MMNLADLCRDVFLLAQLGIDGSGPVRGRRWEQRVTDHLAMKGVPVEPQPGGYSVLGHVSLSRLKHQIDGTLGCADAIIMAEWKAFKHKLPKNELLRFKAATDDYFMAFGNEDLSRPVIRIFGGIGEASDSVRAYAHHHGIVLIERGRWPVPVLVSDRVFSPRPHSLNLGAVDRKHLAWAVRPMQRVLMGQDDGAFVVPKPPENARIEALLSLHDQCSEALWEEWDREPGRFEDILSAIEYRLSR